MLRELDQVQPPSDQGSHRVPSHHMPIFLFAGLSGDLNELAPLLSASAGRLRFVPITYPHWSVMRRGLHTLDQFAAHCIPQMECHGPLDTILLAGYSFGGHVAWRVAELLAASGRPTERLWLIDVNANPSINNGPRSLAGRLRNLIRKIGRGEVRNKLAHAAAGTLLRSRREWPLRTLEHSLRIEPVRRLLRRVDIAVQMRFHFQHLCECLAGIVTPGTPAGFPAVLFRCAIRESEASDDLGWGRYLANLRVVSIPADHMSIMQERNISQMIGEIVTDVSNIARHRP